MRLGPLSVLGHREYAVVFGASLLSNVGTWMQISALGIFVAETTGKVAWVGLITTATYLATGLFSPLGGTLSDRFDRRRVILFATSGEGVFSILLVVALATGHDSPALLWLLAGIQGSLAAIVIPALHALMPDLVREDEIHAAASLNAASWNIGRAAGPLLAVLVIAVSSYETVFLINGISYFCIGLAMLTVAKRDHNRIRRSTRALLAAGWGELTTNGNTRRPLLISAAHMALIAPFISFIPAMAQLTLDGTKNATGFLYGVQGLGSAIGVILLAALVLKLGQNRTLSLALIGSAVCAVGYGSSPSILFALAWLLPLSAFHTSVLSTCTGLTSRHSEPTVRGGVLGLYLMITNLSYALSSSALALVADQIGLRLVIIVTALAFLLLIALGLLRPHEPDSAEGLDPIQDVG